MTLLHNLLAALLIIVSIIGMAVAAYHAPGVLAAAGV